ncbi:MAG: GMP synthase, partial [Chitinophagales bacterium]
MKYGEPKSIRIALLDLNEGKPNQGMRCIHQIIDEWEMDSDIKVDRQVFDVRVMNELPDTSFDIYISSGGPGDPISTRYDDWDINWNKWVDEMLRWNENPSNKQKKYV